MSGLAPLTENELLEFARNWYRKLDDHAPLENFLPLLAEEGLEMVFPEATVYGFEGFKGWYARVINIFFDENHTVKEVKLTAPGSPATVKVLVKWEASTWKPPAPYSERIILDAYQTWVVVRSAKTGRPTVLKYVVDSLDFAEGSAMLPT
jgi:hypothetical protein